MSKEVKRYYTTLAFDRPDIAANCSIQGRPATCTSYELTCVVLASDYDTLLAERDALAKDAERYRWLRQRLVGASFDWDDEGMTVLAFEMPDGVSIGADCDKNIDVAMAGGRDE